MEAAIERTLELPLFRSGETMQVPVTRVLCDIQTDFQHVLVVDTVDFGRCLIIDNVMQISEHDHHLYDAELLRMLDKNDEKILILGGGDGYIAKRALTSNPLLEVTIADLDVEVIKMVEQYFNQDVFHSQQVRLFIGDAHHFMRLQKGKFDGIICDLTDSPIGAHEQGNYEQFYRDIIKNAAYLLTEDGWLSIQSGASSVATGFINQAGLLEPILRTYFEYVERTDLLVPSYGESCAFLFGRKPKK